jgi:hypothetical protein
MGDGSAASVSAGGTFTGLANSGRRGVLIRSVIMTFVIIAHLIYRTFLLFLFFSFSLFFVSVRNAIPRRGECNSCGSKGILGGVRGQSRGHENRPKALGAENPGLTMSQLDAPHDSQTQ